MAFEATVYRVLIASPSDVGNERNIVTEVIHDWNLKNSVQYKVVLLPVRWEKSATPEMGERPQEILNKQIVRSADLVIGVFWTKLGTQTGNAESGSVEEIHEFLDAKRPVLLYFSERVVSPGKIDQVQYQRLLEFRKWCQDKGIYWRFKTSAALRADLDVHLTSTVRRLSHAFELDPVSTGQLHGSSDGFQHPENNALVLSKEASPQSANGHESAPAHPKFDDGKACLSLSQCSVIPDSHNFCLQLVLKNHGRAMAREVQIHVSAESGEYRVGEERTVPTGIESTWILKFSASRNRIGISKETRRFRVAVRFKDNLGRDDAEYLVILRHETNGWTAVIDPDGTVLSEQCRNTPTFPN